MSKAVTQVTENCQKVKWLKGRTRQKMSGLMTSCAAWLSPNKNVAKYRL